MRRRFFPVIVILIALSTILLNAGSAGAMLPTTLGGLVWNDINANGVQEEGEAGLSGITVNLYDNSDSLVTTTITDTEGKYLFNNLAPDTYSVEFIAPTGYSFSPQVQGRDGARVSDVDPGTGKTVKITLFPGQNDDSWDAGLF
jgi:hypothetical protein